MPWWKSLINTYDKYVLNILSSTPGTSEMELFVSLVNGFKLLINVLKNTILDVVGVLDIFYFIKLQVQSLQIEKNRSPWQVFFKDFHHRNIAVHCITAFCRTHLFTGLHTGLSFSKRHRLYYIWNLVHIQMPEYFTVMLK